MGNTINSFHVVSIITYRMVMSRRVALSLGLSGHKGLSLDKVDLHKRVGSENLVRHSAKFSHLRRK